MEYVRYMTDVINIDDCQYLSRGTVKLVFAHPRFPDSVIKVINPKAVDELGQFARQSSWKKKRKLGIYRYFQREVEQYLRLCRAHYSIPTSTFPIAIPRGFVQTSIGLGLISELIRNDDGAIAPTLTQLVAAKQFSAIHAKALETFFQRCIDLHIVFGEVNSAGLLFTTTRSAEPQFVLVDGIGEKNLIPFKTWSFEINKRRVLKVREQILSECGISAPSN